MNKLAALLSEPLALQPSAVPGLLTNATCGDDLNIEQEELCIDYFDPEGQQIEAAERSGASAPHLTAVMPLFGVVSRHGLYRAGTAELGRSLQRLDADSEVGTIVLYINSPGGSVYGTRELADQVFAIRENSQTTIVAAVDPLMASAATWIGTAAEKVYAIPSADVGSIGVISAYADMSRMLTEAGIDYTIVRTPEAKARFSGVEPLTDAMREEMESGVREAYSWFVSAMARNRGVNPEQVEERFGAGEVMSAEKAVKAGLIDGIVGSVEEVVRDAGSRYRQSRRRSAAASNRAKLDLIDQT